MEDKGILLPFIAQLRPLIILQSDYRVPKQKQMHLIKRISGQCQSRQPGVTPALIKSRRALCCLPEACRQPPLQRGLHTDKTLLLHGFCPLQATCEIPGTRWETDPGLRLEHQTQLQLLHISDLLWLWTHKEILWQVIHFIYCTSFKSTRPKPSRKA